MNDKSLAEIIARTFCESDGKCWGDLGPTDRHRYFHAGRLAQDRIREVLLNGSAGLDMASELIFGTEPELPSDPLMRRTDPGCKPH